MTELYRSNLISRPLVNHLNETEIETLLLGRLETLSNILLDVGHDFIFALLQLLVNRHNRFNALQIE